MIALLFIILALVSNTYGTTTLTDSNVSTPTVTSQDTTTERSNGATDPATDSRTKTGTLWETTPQPTRSFTFNKKERSALDGSLSLVNSDGQELDLEQLDIRGAMYGALFYAEYKLVFKVPANASGQEGKFKFQLPASAIVSRFAMDVNGVLMEGEVVDRDFARKTYRSYLYESVDPALLEREQGNVFSTRIFPLSPNQLVKLVLSYSVRLEAEKGLRELYIPLTNLPVASKFSMSLLAVPLSGEELVSQQLPKGATFRPVSHSPIPAGFSEECKKSYDESLFELKEYKAISADVTCENFSSINDIVVRFGATEVNTLEDTIRSVKVGSLVSADTKYAMFSVALESDFVVEKDLTPHLRYDIYVDTSASMTISRQLRLQLLEQLLVTLVSKAEEHVNLISIHVFAFDLEVEEIGSHTFEKNASGATKAKEWIQLIQERGTLGMTNLEGVIKHAFNGDPFDNVLRRILLVTDGIATIGELISSYALGQAVTEMQRGNEQVYSLALAQSIVDEKTLQSLGTDIQVGKDVSVDERGNGNVVNIKAAVDSAYVALVRPPPVRLEFEIPSSSWAFPTSALLHVGDEVLIVAEQAKSGSLELSVSSVDSRPVQVNIVSNPIVEEFTALVTRECKRSLIENLQQQMELSGELSEKEELRVRIVEESQKARILSDETSLIVLENEEEYKRWGIARDSVSPLLTVTDVGIKQTSGGVFDDETTFMNTRVVSECIVKSVDYQACGEDVTSPPTTTTTTTRATEAVSTSTASLSTTSGVATSGFETGSGFEDPLDFEGIPDGGNFASSGKKNNPSSIWLVVLAIVLCLCVSDVSATDYDRRSNVAQLIETEKYAEAIVAAQEWQSVDSQDVYAYEALGKAAFELGKRKLAIRAYTSIAEISPTDAGILSHTGTLLLSIKEYALAETVLRLALSERDDDINIYRYLFFSLWLQGRFDEAAEVYTRGKTVSNPSGQDSFKRNVFQGEYEYMLYDKQFADEVGTKVVSLPNPTVKSTYTISWITDATDVDLYALFRNVETSYSNADGGSLKLLHDVTGGLGPEQIYSIDARTQKDKPKISANLYGSRTGGISRGCLCVMNSLRNGEPIDIEFIPYAVVGKDEYVPLYP